MDLFYYTQSTEHEAVLTILSPAPRHLWSMNSLGQPVPITEQSQFLFIYVYIFCKTPFLLLFIKNYLSDDPLISTVRFLSFQPHLYPVCSEIPSQQHHEENSAEQKISYPRSRQHLCLSPPLCLLCFSTCTGYSNLWIQTPHTLLTCSPAFMVHTTL